MPKIDGRKLSHKALEHMRLLRCGESWKMASVPAMSWIPSVSAAPAFIPGCADTGTKGWRLGGEDAQGPEPKLSEKQRQQVRRWILGKDPRQHGFDFGLWTRRIVQT